MRLAPLLVLCGFLVVTVGCKHELPPTDAGPIAQLGEGEGDGEGEGEGDCPDVHIVGLVVRLIDTTTQFRLCNAVVQIHDGAYGETLGLTGDGATGNETCQYEGARDRPGTYEVVVSAPDHVGQTIAGETVTADDCGDPVQTILTVPVDQG